MAQNRRTFSASTAAAAFLGLWCLIIATGQLKRARADHVELLGPCSEITYEPGKTFAGDHIEEKLRQAAHLRCYRCCERARMKYSYMAEEAPLLVCHCTNEF